MSPVLTRVRESTRRTQARYAAAAEDDRPLAGYLVAMGMFGTVTAAVAALGAVRGRQEIGTRDLALLGFATHKLARILTKDAVASPLRAPFTRFVGPAGPGEVAEEVRGHGVQHAAGELLTCPFCLSPWVATALLAGLTVAPRATRQVTTVFTAVTVADLLQLTYAAMERHAKS